jgi:hypothetical protein
MLLLLLIGCPDDPPEPFDYAEGSYLYEFSDWTGGDCEFDAVSQNADSAEAEVVRTSGEDFDADFGNDNPLVCGVAGMVMACQASEPIVNELSTHDATITVRWSVVGEWLDASHMAGTFTHDFECEGAGCDDLSGSIYGGDAVFPCDKSGTWSAERI